MLGTHKRCMTGQGPSSNTKPAALPPRMGGPPKHSASSSNQRPSAHLCDWSTAWPLECTLPQVFRSRTLGGAGKKAAGAHLTPTTCWPPVASMHSAAAGPLAAAAPPFARPSRSSSADSKWGRGSKPTSSSARSASGPRLSTACAQAGGVCVWAWECPAKFYAGEHRGFDQIGQLVRLAACDCMW